MMVVVATLVYFLTVLLAPRKGKLAKWSSIRKQNIKILQEDILKLAIKNESPISTALIKEKLNPPNLRLKEAIKYLLRNGELTQNMTAFSLSAAGQTKATQLVRAHRLWETYLVDKMGLNEGQIHPEAEALEHHLTPEILDQVDGELNYPETDPHGSPIPSKKKN